MNVYMYMYVYMHLLVFEILTTFAFLQYFYSYAIATKSQSVYRVLLAYRVLKTSPAGNT